MQYLIALSGGLDSSVLLHLFASQQYQSNITIRAIHIHHGLQTEADNWVIYCKEICDKYNIPLLIKYINAKAPKGKSPEAHARELRYQAIAEVLYANEVLVTAHHQNDQAETLLLHLARGAGPQGLAAMPAFKNFAQGWHWRPLLNFSRKKLEAYAKQHQLAWVDDESNKSLQFDRNFLRHQIIPKFETRWPQFIANLKRVSDIQAEISDYLDFAIQPLWQQLPHALAQVDVHPLFKTNHCLSLDLLAQQPALLRSWFLRDWLKQKADSIISFEQEKIIEQQVVMAQADKNPQLKIGSYLLCRYARALWLILPTETDFKFTTKININEKISLPNSFIELREDGIGIAINKSKLNGKALSIRFRSGTVKFHPHNRDHSQTLKKLFQEWKIPPWQRDVIPLLFADDELVAVCNIAIAKNFHPIGEEERVYLNWDVLLT